MSFLKSCHWALLLLSALVLGGCATSAVTRSDAGTTLNLQAKANEGFVLLKVIATRPISMLNPKWQHVKVRDAAGNYHEINDLTASTNMFMSSYVPTESLYFARLPQGEYEIPSGGSIGPGPGLLLALLSSDHTAVDGQLPRFTVSAGRVANLGTVVLAPEIDKTQPTQMLLLSGPQGKRAALQDLLSEVDYKQALPAEGGGWSSASNDDGPTLERARRLVSVLSVPPGEPAGSTFTAGSHLGTIFVRSSTGTWEQQQIDTLDRVVFARRLPDGTWLAGFDYGRYAVKRPGAGWEPFQLPGEKARVMHIEPRADNSALFVVSDLKRTRVLLRPALEGRTDEARQLALRENLPNQHLLTQGAALVLSGNEPGISREALMTTVDKQTLAVATRTEKFWVMDWQYLPDGGLVLARMNGLSVLRSTDAGTLQSWQHSEDKAHMTSYWLDRDNGYAMAHSGAITTVSSFLQRTRDGGRSWERVGTPLLTENIGGRLIHADTREVLVQAANVVYSTADEGRTWNQILPPKVAAPQQ